MAKINFYRNISLTFIIFAVMLICAVILLFYSQATIIVYGDKQDINLSFNAQVKNSPTSDELAQNDVVGGSVVSDLKKASGTFAVLSTKSGSSDIVGMVKLVNTSVRNQQLVKTTQLQAGSGVIVRTIESVNVPAGGSVEVGVYPKDPAGFSDISMGEKLVVIKLNPSLQDQIFGTALEKLTAQPRQIKVLAESDINRAKADLQEQVFAQARQEMGLTADEPLDGQLLAYQTDKKAGDETDSFVLTGEFKIKRLEINQEQLSRLIGRKIQNLSLKGLVPGAVDDNKIKYSILETYEDGSALVKIEYVVTASLAAGNEALDRKNFSGKTIEEIKQYADNSDIIKSIEVYISPYWQKTVPKQENRIRVIIRQ